MRASEDMDTFNILIVDDTPINISTMKAMLEQMGTSRGLKIEITTAANALEALEAVEVLGRPDFIITDLHMGGGDLDGDYLVMKIGNIKPNVPVFACTSASHEEVARRFGILEIQGSYGKHEMPFMIHEMLPGMLLMSDDPVDRQENETKDDNVIVLLDVMKQSSNCLKAAKNLMTLVQPIDKSGEDILEIASSAVDNAQKIMQAALQTYNLKD